MQKILCPRKDSKVVTFVLDHRETRNIFDIVKWARENTVTSATVRHFLDHLRQTMEHFSEIDARLREEGVPSQNPSEEPRMMAAELVPPSGYTFVEDDDDDYDGDDDY